MRKTLAKKAGKFFAVMTTAVFMAGALAGCGASNTITVVSREDGSGSRGAFIELFGIEEKDADGNKVDHTTADAQITNKTDVMLTTVAQDEKAIGYVSMGSLNDTVKAVKINGVEATAENIKNGTYEIQRPFNLATKTDISDAAKDFMNFILSAEGQAIIEENNCVSIDENAAAYTSNHASGKVVVGGSSSVTPIMEKLAEAYKDYNANVTVEVQQSDSTTGMQEAMEGICDIGMASRDLKDTELEQLTPTVIALDGVAVIVNKKNTVEDLTKDQVKAIYTGEQTTWE